MDFLETPYLYTILLVFSASYPLAQSFEWRIKYYKKWDSLAKSTLLMMLIFIPWDIWFTAKKVWWFNHDYTLSLDIFGLPVEEWSFFIIVPFACVFIYEVLNYYVKKDILAKVSKPISPVLGITLITLGSVFNQQLYTSITFTATGVALLVFYKLNPAWAGRFYLTYFVSWTPFMLINGALTGNFTQDAVVNYHPEQFIGVRVTTIPIEDSVYNLLMLLMVVCCYEYFEGKKLQKS